jgi:sugar phosphate permease
MFIQKNKYLPFFMWLFPLLFFSYQFILRLWPGLMMQTIMEQFAIDASHFGMLAAFYYYGYAGMQIPVAVLLEKFGVRYIVLGFAVLLCFATILFTYTDNWYLALLSRFLIGAGSAAGFLSVSKVVVQWFAKAQYARMIGLSFSFGLIGAIFGGKPISLCLENYQWQNVALTLAIISIFIGCGAYLMLGSGQQKQDVTANSVNGQFKLVNFKTILTSPVIWAMAIANLLMVGSLEGLTDVWGVPYLVTAYNIHKSDAAQLISMVFFGMLFGGPLLAFMSKKLDNYTVIAMCGFGMALLVILLLRTNTYSWWWLAGILFTIGMMCCYQVIVFAAGSELVPENCLGVTIAFLNCINMLGGSFFHTVIGKIMDLFWTGITSAGTVRCYDLGSYNKALIVIPVCAVIGAIIVCIVGSKSRKSLK